MNFQQIKDLYDNYDEDGRLFRDKVNTASDEIFEKWMEYIYKFCEEPSTVGYSMHGLLICKK